MISTTVNCDCERLWYDITALRTEYQEHHGRAYDEYHIDIEEAIKTDPKSFFLGIPVYIDLKKKWMSYQLASGTQGICDLFAEFIEQTYVDDSWFPSSFGPDFVNDELSFGLLQFNVFEVENALLELDSSKGSGPMAFHR
jgi:hypothetical protein